MSTCGHTADVTCSYCAPYYKIEDYSVFRIDSASGIATEHIVQSINVQAFDGSVVSVWVDGKLESGLAYVSSGEKAVDECFERNNSSTGDAVIGDSRRCCEK